MNTVANGEREAPGESREVAKALGAGTELDTYLESISNIGNYWPLSLQHGWFLGSKALI